MSDKVRSDRSHFDVDVPSRSKSMDADADTDANTDRCKSAFRAMLTP